MELTALILFVIGSLLIFISSVGLVRMADPYLMLQATGVGSTLGITCIFLATGLYFDHAQAWVFSGLSWLLMLFTSPISTHMLSLAVFWNRPENQEQEKN